MSKPSRRSFVGLLFGFFIPRWRAAGGSPPAAGSGGEPALGSAKGRQFRRYRADATVLLWGMPVFKRAGVGGGQAFYQEAPDRHTLFFAAGSDPERAQGLKRVGWISEVVRATGSNPTEATYFGVLTSSPEESLKHARKSVAESAQSRSVFSAVTGTNTIGRSRSALARFEFPSETKWSDQRLIGEAQSALAGGGNWRETSWPKSTASAPPTFLFELARLLKQRAGRASGRYVYNEQEYKLEVEFPQDGRRPGELVPVRGTVRNLRSGCRTEFRLWVENEPDSVVPVRIEFQPRPFLRLTFEAERA